MHSFLMRKGRSQKRKHRRNIVLDQKPVACHVAAAHRRLPCEESGHIEPDQGENERIRVALEHGKRRNLEQVRHSQGGAGAERNSEDGRVPQGPPVDFVAAIVFIVAGPCVGVAITSHLRNGL